MNTMAGGIQVSGVRCQRTTLTRWARVAHNMVYISPVLALSRIQISVPDSVFTDT
ncbi:MAG: hypothetical protein PVH85_24235 [Desulfobacterales bacterium]